MKPTVRARHCLLFSMSAVLVLTLAACGSGGGDSGTTPGAAPGDPTAGTPPGNPASNPTGNTPGNPAPASYTPLSWADPQPATQYTLADGTLVTRVGGRTRDRHAREMPNPHETGGSDPYTNFAAHYFERRSHDITIYDNVSPDKPDERVITMVVRPQWWLYGTNFRHSFIGRRDNDAPGPTAVALYGDNGGMKLLPAFSLPSGKEFKAPISQKDYDLLPGDPPQTNDAQDLNVPPKDGEFVLVKRITRSASLNRNLKAGDLLEFELGIFLSGKHDDVLGRFNYYSDVMVYQVGQTGVLPWYRGAATGAAIPWDSHAIPVGALSGGAMMTLQEDTSNNPEMNFLQAGTNIAGINIQSFLEGRRLFHTSFLTGSHTEAGNPTLFSTQAGKAGPKFQQPACISCHFGNGKSSPTLNAPLTTEVVLTADVGRQRQARARRPLRRPPVAGAGHREQAQLRRRQALLKIDSYTETPGQYADKTPYALQKPHYALSDLAGKALDLPARLSVRTAPHLPGMGLLEAVPETVLEQLAAASAKDADGAVGRLQIVSDLVDPKLKRVGRFGWRATAASVLQQTAAALNTDMGVTTSVLPKHLCGQATAGDDCRAADAHGPELADKDLELMVRYASLLAVPPQRHFKGEQPLAVYNEDIVAQAAAQTADQVAAENRMQDRVAAGAQLFEQARCTACHVATLVTGGQHRLYELRNQTIHPYTDLLLHDMGPELADGFPQGVATAQEWRTAPLWGLGLLASLNAGTRYLHDGRARTLEEAILWHGGQGKPSADRFKALNADNRQKVIDFLKSL